MSVLPACAGAISRAEFDSIVQARGGGVSVASFAEVTDTLRGEVGADPIVRRAFFGVNPTYGSFSLQLGPGIVDDYVIYGRDVRSVRPQRDPDEQPTVRLSEVPIDRFEAMADEALAYAGIPGGYVEYISVQLSLRRITFAVESARATARVEFDFHGELQEVQRR